MPINVDVRLTYEDLPLLQAILQALLEHLWGRRLETDMRKIQGPGTALKFGGIIWLKKTFIVPEVVIVKMQTY